MILAVDTSTRSVGIALYDGVQVVAESLWRSSSYHTVELAPAVEALMRRADVSVDGLRAVAVAIGPGSFTALRIGLAFAKGLALSRGLALVGIPTLDVVAATQPLDASSLLAVLEAGRRRLAVERYRPGAERWERAGELISCTLDELVSRIEGPTRVCGELDARARQVLGEHSRVVLATPAESTRRPGVLAELGWGRLQSGAADDPVALAPLYLHHGDPIPGG